MAAKLSADRKKKLKVEMEKTLSFLSNTPASVRRELEMARTEKPSVTPQVSRITI